MSFLTPKIERFGHMLNAPVICVMGPTASGKTPLAVQLVQQFPCEIISVDSAQVYRGLNIGAAKPTADILALAPHRLIDVREASSPYSAGDFLKDVQHEIDAVMANGKIPLLVGGTMLYYRVLQQGIANLPNADATIRAALDERVRQEGLQSLYQALTVIDPESASRIQPNDSQRIKRAIEVYQVTGKPISYWQKTTTCLHQKYTFYNIVLLPEDRKALHARIAMRFQNMMTNGFLEEMQRLYERTDLHATLPAMRAVGYRQGWAYLAGEYGYDEMVEKAIIATRQLAKRQITWLRQFQADLMLDPLQSGYEMGVKNYLEQLFVKEDVRAK